MTTYKNAAVLTGDIIKSSALSPEELDMAFDQLRKTAGLLGKKFDIDLHFTRSRGDGWQVVLEHAVYAHIVTLTLRAGVKSIGKAFDTRVCVGFGNVTLAGPTLADAHGSAFIRSGHGLDKMSKSNAFAADGRILPCLPLFQAISNEWTVKQSQVAHATLLVIYPTLTELAQEMGVTPQTISTHFEAAHMSEVFDALEALFDEFDTETNHDKTVKKG